MNRISEWKLVEIASTKSQPYESALISPYKALTEPEKGSVNLNIYMVRLHVLSLTICPLYLGSYLKITLFFLNGDMTFSS